MELGGHAPVLIFDDCDLEKTLDMVVPQKFRNAGQVCVSPTRFYVQKRHLRRVHQGLRRAHRQGEGRQRPRRRTRRWARSPTARRPDAIGELVEDAEAKGARVLAGGERGDGGFFFQPTLARRRPQRGRHHERGAVRPGRGLAPVRHASTKRSSRPTACPSASPPSPSPRMAAARTCIGDLVESGMVGINTFAISGADTPFGGVKDCGFGSEGGKEGLGELPGGEGDSPGLSCLS